MLKLLWMGLPLVPVAVALAQAHPTSAGSPGPVSDGVRCEIRESRLDGEVQLEGIVVSDAPLAGTYEFDVKKQGRAGTSTSSQSGIFDVTAEEEGGLGQVGLRMERGATYSAELTVRWPGGEASCVAHYPDRA